MMRNLKNELYKILIGRGFWLSVLAVFSICLFTNIYDDFTTDTKYSVLGALMTFDSEMLAEDWHFCAYEVIRQGTSGWISFFLPIVVAFPCIPLLCDVYESRYVRFEIFRSSKLSFLSAKLFSSFLCGAIAAAAGYALYAIFVAAIFPSPSELTPWASELYPMLVGIPEEKLSGFSYVLLVLRKERDVFFWGGLNVMPAAALAGLSKNKYVITCIPFFLKYALKLFCQKMQLLMFFGERTAPAFSKAIALINPDALANLSTHPAAFQWQIAIFSVFMFFLYFTCHLIIQKGRWDCGE